MLTSFPTIRRAVKKMSNIDRMMKDGTFDTLSKRKTASNTPRLQARMLGSIQDLTRLPAALFVVDVMKNALPWKSQSFGNSVFGIVDTNSDPSEVDFVIPANDDASKAIDLILGYICDAIKEGLEERKIEKADAAAAEEQDEENAAPRRERKSKVAKRTHQKRRQRCN